VLMCSMSCCQWRARIAGLRRSVMSGMVFLKASMMSLSQPHTGHALTSRPSFVTCLLKRAAVSSISSTCVVRTVKRLAHCVNGMGGYGYYTPPLALPAGLEVA
jgi:hypothetical protein